MKLLLCNLKAHVSAVIRENLQVFIPKRKQRKQQHNQKFIRLKNLKLT